MARVGNAAGRREAVVSTGTKARRAQHAEQILTLAAACPAKTERPRRKNERREERVDVITATIAITCRDTVSPQAGARSRLRRHQQGTQTEQHRKGVWSRPDEIGGKTGSGWAENRWPTGHTGQQPRKAATPRGCRTTLREIDFRDGAHGGWSRGSTSGGCRAHGTMAN